MPPTIQDRAIKCLHPLPAFTPVSDMALPAQLASGESLLGMYQPTPGAETILITDLGIHLDSSGKQYFLSYRQIVGIDSHHNKKELASQPSLRTLNFRLGSGEIVKVPFSGEREHYLDMFDVWRFLNYVLADIKREKENALTT